MTGGQQQGFTILETLIFLAVSGVLFLGALNLISTKQARTEFTAGINTVRSSLQSALGNVGNGYYQTQPNLRCSATSAKLTFSTGGGLGSSTGCVYLGEVVEFGINGFAGSAGGEGYNSYPVAGYQYAWQAGVPTTSVSTSLVEAKPTIINLSGAAQPVLTSLPYGIKLDSNNQGSGSGICYFDSNSPPAKKCHAVNTNAFALFTTFNSYAPNSSNLSTGAQGVNIIPLPNQSSTNWLFNWNGNQALNPNLSDSCATTNTVCTPPGVGIDVPINPDGGIYICLDSGSTNESAEFIIGGSNNPTGVSMTRYSNTGCV